MTIMVEIEGYVIHETDRALLISAERMGNIATDCFLPKSQVRVIDEKPDGRTRLEVAEWLVRKKSLFDLVVLADADEARRTA